VPPPPPPEDDPPHAARKINPENTAHPSRNPKSFFLREVMPVPSNASPPIGSHIAKKIPLDCGASDAVVAAVVLTVKTAVPVPFDIAAGLSVHVGGRATTGVTAHVRLTVPLKPLVGAMVMVEVAVPPAVTAAGERADAAIVKSAAAAAVTVRFNVVLWFTPPAPATVTT
jgi:hypothetical protein